MKQMNVLVACEYSGVVRDAFKARGHHAVSCDIIDTQSPGNHILGDVMDIIDDGWDLMIAHPPCTYLCVTGNRWMGEQYRDRYPTRLQNRSDAIEFFMSLINASIPHIAVENPVGIMSTQYRKPDQYVQPYEHGDTLSKKTGLWLKNLPKLVPSNVVEPEMITLSSGKKMSKWFYDTSNLPLKIRSMVRSRTFDGIASAMASQWG